MSKIVLFQTIQFSQQNKIVPNIAIYHKQFYETSAICLHTVKSQNSSISNNSV